MCLQYLGCCVVLALSFTPCGLSWCRYDRFIDAFEHVSTVIDDIYKVNKALCSSPEREREREREREGEWEREGGREREKEKHC